MDLISRHWKRAANLLSFCCLEKLRGEGVEFRGVEKRIEDRRIID